MYDEYGIQWHIEKGDLVKVKITNPNGWDRNEIETHYGIVIEKPEKSQITMFPEVSVYLMKMGKIKTFPAGAVEIISPHNGNEL